MQGLYDYLGGYITEVPYRLFVGMADTSNVETPSFPVTVYNVSNTAIGTANDKEEYMSIWNGNSANRVVGKLTGYYGPFAFEMLVNPGQTPPAFVFGVSVGAVVNYLVDTDGNNLVDQSGYKIYIS